MSSKNLVVDDERAMDSSELLADAEEYSQLLETKLSLSDSQDATIRMSSTSHAQEELTPQRMVELRAERDRLRLLNKMLQDTISSLSSVQTKMNVRLSSLLSQLANLQKG